MSQTAQQTFQETWNKLWQMPEIQALLPRMPSFRYYQVKKDYYAFAWTTEPVKGKFYALVYRITKTHWKMKKRVEFGRRKIAKARALKWYRQRKEKLGIA